MMTATEMGGLLKEDARKADEDCKCGVTISDVAVVHELASRYPKASNEEEMRIYKACCTFETFRYISYRELCCDIALDN